MDSQLRTYTSYSADAAQRDDDEKGSHKGPPLKIGRNHKLAHHYIEQKILGEPIEGRDRRSAYPIFAECDRDGMKPDPRLGETGSRTDKLPNAIQRHRHGPVWSDKLPDTERRRSVATGSLEGSTGTVVAGQ